MSDVFQVYIFLWIFVSTNMHSESVASEFSEFHSSLEFRLVRMNLKIIFYNVTKGIKEDIYACKHQSSMDEKAMHDNCPARVDCWCKWRVAQSAGKQREF